MPARARAGTTFASALARKPSVVLVLASLVPACLVALPIGITLADATSAGTTQIVELLWRPLVGRLLLNTVLLTAVGATCCAAIGATAAILVERTDLPGRGFWAALSAAPLAVPAFIASYAWVSISPELEGFLGALLVTVFAYSPLVFLPVAATLRGLDPAQEEVARALGNTGWNCIRRVVLPQLRPAILGGALLVALNILVEFGAFALMRFRTFTTEIYAAYRLGFAGAEAAALAVVLLLLCLACLGGESALRRNAHYARIGSGTRRPATLYRLGGWRIPALAGLAVLALLSLGVPLGCIAYWITRHGAAAITPEEASPRALLAATVSTIELGIGGALLTTVVALPLAILATRWPRFRLTALLERAAWMAPGVPGIVIALALITATVQTLPVLYESTLLLLIAYATLFLPYALVALRATLLQVDHRLEEAARGLGARPVRVLMTVTLPLAAPGIGAAVALVFIAITTELTATLLLAPIGTTTLAIQVWGDTSTVAFAAAAPYAAVLVGLSIVATWLLARRFGAAALHGDLGG